MRFVSFTNEGGGPGFGRVVGDRVVDLTQRLGPEAGSLRALIASGRLAEAAALEVEPDLVLANLVLAPVIPDPDKIICVGLNYGDHVAEAGRTVTEKPALFARFSDSQVGHLQPMVRPTASEQFDYEGELAVIIGRGGRHIQAGQALQHVAGYSCYNEGSIRDWQRHTGQFLAGKTFAATGGFGPWLVTSDEIPDPGKLTLETRVNGEVVQHTTTDLLITGIPSLIAYISTIIPLLPGDVIVSGTPAGIGSRRLPPLWLKPGDTVEVEISGVGVLRNPVVDEQP